MGKAINALINAADEESKDNGKVKILFKEFEPFELPKKVKTVNPHERVVTAIREVKYLRDGFVREENVTRKIVLESNGYETVTEVLVPRDLAAGRVPPKVVGSVTRDLRRKEEN